MTDERIGTTVGDRFRLLSVIGEGGMGTVYLADDEAAGGKAAVKFLRRHLMTNADFVARFRQEARSASRFHHDSAVRILATGEDTTGVPYIAMEFCGGRSLKEILREEGPLPVARACHIAEQVLRALGEAHKSGIIHRDLKPANIKVESGDEGERAKILDFGVAKFVGDEDSEEMSGAVKTKTGVVFGTPKYMAPEQILGEPVDSRSDIYSVGAILYEMLTGTPPFVSDDILGFVTKHMKDPVEPPSHRAPEIEFPALLEQTVIEMLEKNRVARHARAGDVADTLSTFARGAGLRGIVIGALRGLGFLAGGLAGALLASVLAPAQAGSSIAAAAGLGIGSTVAFLLLPRSGEVAFWLRAAIVAAALGGAGGISRAIGSPAAVTWAMCSAALLLFVLFSAGWGSGSRLMGALMGGLLGPLVCLPFLPYPAGDGYVRLWSLDATDPATAGPAMALLVIGIAYAAGGLIAPEARRVSRR